VSLSERPKDSIRPAEKDSVPFVRPFFGTGRVQFSANLGSLSVSHDDASVTLGSSELPLGIFAIRDNNYLAVIRTMPDDQLIIRQLAADGSTVANFPVMASIGTQPMFRSARLEGDTLYLVYYDNITQANILARYRVSDGLIAAEGEPITLPLLLDPAGGTYEMIPWVGILPSGNAVHIVGGTLNARLIGDVVEESRLAGCLKVIEAVATPSGPAALCLAPEEAEAPYLVLAPVGISLPELNSDAVPYGLSFAEGTLSIKHADDAGSYREMLVFDI